MAQSQSPINPARLKVLKETLLEKREDLLLVVQRKKERELPSTEVGDEADVATQSLEKEMLFELTDTEQQTLDDIEAALRKIEKGGYGLCESCRKPIPLTRLGAMPWARYCVSCQARQETPRA
ncbi:MAG: TraR/DksA family transcriptional regulator [Elusimicrobia bacterium]|nr:TraR/DksA family transcriptional regulator [Elusimicrobiota bacterium]